MGAWGYKSFENDSAVDWLGDLTDGDASLVGMTLDTAGADDDAYLDDYEASTVLAAAELVAAALGRGDDRLDAGAATWLNMNRSALQRVHPASAHRAVERVFSSSELRALWDEQGNDAEWHADVRELLKRLV